MTRSFDRKVWQELVEFLSDEMRGENGIIAANIAVGIETGCSGGPSIRIFYIVSDKKQDAKKREKAIAKATKILKKIPCEKAFYELSEIKRQARSILVDHRNSPDGPGLANADSFMRTYKYVQVLEGICEKRKKGFLLHCAALPSKELPKLQTETKDAISILSNDKLRNFYDEGVEKNWLQRVVSYRECKELYGKMNRGGSKECERDVARQMETDTDHRQEQWSLSKNIIKSNTYEEKVQLVTILKQKNHEDYVKKLKGKAIENFLKSPKKSGEPENDRSRNPKNSKPERLIGEKEEKVNAIEQLVNDNGIEDISTTTNRQESSVSKDFDLNDGVKDSNNYGNDTSLVHYLGENKQTSVQQAISFSQACKVAPPASYKGILNVNLASASNNRSDNEKSLKSKSTHRYQLEEDITDDGKNIMRNKVASMEKSGVNDYKGDKMDKNHQRAYEPRVNNNLGNANADGSSQEVSDGNNQEERQGLSSSSSFGSASYGRHDEISSYTSSSSLGGIDNVAEFAQNLANNENIAGDKGDNSRDLPLKSSQQLSFAQSTSGQDNNSEKKCRRFVACSAYFTKARGRYSTITC